MAGLKRKYIALTGITFDKLKIRVEVDQELPANVPQPEIESLLEQRAIRLKEEESEGAKK